MTKAIIILKFRNLVEWSESICLGVVQGHKSCDFSAVLPNMAFFKKIFYGAATSK